MIEMGAEFLRKGGRELQYNHVSTVPALHKKPIQPSTKTNRRRTQRYLDRIYRIDRIFSYLYTVHTVILSIKGKRQLNTHISKVPAHDMNPCNNQRK